LRFWTLVLLQEKLTTASITAQSFPVRFITP